MHLNLLGLIKSFVIEIAMQEAPPEPQKTPYIGYK